MLIYYGMSSIPQIHFLAHHSFKQKSDESRWIGNRINDVDWMRVFSLIWHHFVNEITNNPLILSASHTNINISIAPAPIHQIASLWRTLSNRLHFNSNGVFTQLNSIKPNRVLFMFYSYDERIFPRIEAKYFLFSV